LNGEVVQEKGEKRKGKKEKNGREKGEKRKGKKLRMKGKFQMRNLPYYWLNADSAFKMAMIVHYSMSQSSIRFTHHPNYSFDVDFLFLLPHIFFRNNSPLIIINIY
jgi:hypothetical protein